LIFIYSVRRDLKLHYLVLTPFTLLPDLDKFLGMVGLLHSLVTILLICVFLFVLEFVVKTKLFDIKSEDRFQYEISLIASFYILSHLFLDVLDGGPVTFLYPFVDVGIGLIFPMTLEINSPFDFRIYNVTPQLVCKVPGSSGCYDVLSGFGVASAILFFAIVSFDRLRAK